jgi:hypothetical protein
LARVPVRRRVHRAGGLLARRTHRRRRGQSGARARVPCPPGAASSRRAGRCVRRVSRPSRGTGGGGAAWAGGGDRWPGRAGPGGARRRPHAGPEAAAPPVRVLASPASAGPIPFADPRPPSAGTVPSAGPSPGRGGTRRVPHAGGRLPAYLPAVRRHGARPAGRRRGRAKRHGHATEHCAGTPPPAGREGARYLVTLSGQVTWSRYRVSRDRTVGSVTRRSRGDAAGSRRRARLPGRAESLRTGRW